MNTSKRRAIGITAIFALAVSATAIVWAAGKARLVMNGKVLSSNVQTFNGQAYVPLSDLAKAQGMVVVKTGGGYELKKAGGATPIAGALRGKVGETLFDSKWRFTVLSAETVDSYTMKHKSTIDYAIYNAIAEFDNDDRKFTPRKDRTLVVVRCRASNGKNSTQSLWLANSDTRTAIADTSGESHPPIGYDIEESGPFQSKALLPGAKIDFTIVFSVPDDSQPKDLVFTLRTISNQDKGSDARVSLAAN